jgi:hypothetical protein
LFSENQAKITRFSKSMILPLCGSLHYLPIAVRSVQLVP